MQIPLLCVGDGDGGDGADEGAFDGAVDAAVEGAEVGAAEADVGAAVDRLTLGEGCTPVDNAEGVVERNA